jgi:hypothetical protein
VLGLTASPIISVPKVGITSALLELERIMLGARLCTMAVEQQHATQERHLHIEQPKPSLDELEAVFQSTAHGDSVRQQRAVRQVVSLSLSTHFTRVENTNVAARNLSGCQAAPCGLHADYRRINQLCPSLTPSRGRWCPVPTSWRTTCLYALAATLCSAQGARTRCPSIARSWPSCRP